MSATTFLMPDSMMARCTCHANLDRRPGNHADDCGLFDCDACGAKVNAGEEHTDDCADRCPHCHSEGPDNDHREGCPTCDTCAQIYPWIPREDGWHYDPPFSQETLNANGDPIGHAPPFDNNWRDWIDEHMRTVHPNVPRRRP